MTYRMIALIAALAATGCAHQPQISDVERCQMDGYEIGTPMMLECTGQRQQVRMQAAAMFFGAARQQSTYNPFAGIQPVRPSFSCIRSGDFTTCN